MSTSKIVLALFCSVSLAACSASKQEEWFVTHNGNMPSAERISHVEKGATKDEVEAVLGAPSVIIPFNENVWIYMSSDVKRMAFFQPEETNRNILKITFGNDDKVTEIANLTKQDGKNITPSQDKTEVKGQNAGFFRKYFGGVGQYNPFAGQSNADRM